MCLDASNNKSYPTDLPVKNGLALWLDAADDTTFSYSSGTSVSQWRDKSGNNRHFFQATVNNQPSRSAVVNSRKAIQFTAVSGQYLRYNSTIINNRTGGSVFVVWRTAGETNAYSQILDNYHGGANAQYAGFSIERNGTADQYYWGFQDTGFTPAGNIGSTAYSNNTTYCYWITKDSTTITGGYNGTSVTPVPSPSSTWTEDTKGWLIGSWGSNTDTFSRYFNGIQCEVIIFNRGLSATERKQVHTYLGQKWGISNTDRSIIDLAGNDDNGLFGNGTVANMPDYDFYNKGALTFNGTSDYVNLGNASSIRMGTSNFTISTWVKILTQTGTPTFKLIITSKNAAAAAAGYGFAWNNSVNKFLWSTANGSSSSEIFTTNTWSSLEGVWANIVMVRQNGATNNGHFYINGVYESLASAATVLNVDTTTNMTIANTADLNSSYWFKGLYGPVHIYNKALSAVEVAQNYEAQKSKFANTIVQQGLVLNLDAGNPYSYGGAGTTFYDVSPTALSWTINNATYNSSDPKYFSYNGSNSWLESSTSAAYDSQTITMECWFYPSPLSQEGFLFEKGAVNSQYSMFLSLTAFYFRTFGGTINNQDLTFASSTYLTANVWNHVICTYNGSIKIIYVNGVQVASVNASGTLNTGQTNQYIGKYGNAGNNYPFNGRIGETRVYNIALSAAQVLQNYNATKGRFGL
jgi:hypothetical protein